MPEFEILFEDADLLVIQKPPGVVVNAADTVHVPTVQSWMHERLLAGTFADNWQSLLPEEFDLEYGTPEEIFRERVGIVHRLDKDTSGALVLAKNPGSLIHLLAQFKQRTTQKEYLCLVHGSFTTKRDVIRLPLMRSLVNRTKFDVGVTGKPAETAYQVMGQYELEHDTLMTLLTQVGATDGKTEAQLTKDYQSYGDFSLIACQPKTGRTHQIRVHFAYLQHPLVGDITYANKWRARTDTLWCPRQFLHAKKLQFTHPRTREQVIVEAPLSADLEQALAQLRTK